MASVKSRKKGKGFKSLVEVEHASTSVSHVKRGVHKGLPIWSSKPRMDGLLVWDSKPAVDGLMGWASKPSEADLTGLSLKTGEWRIAEHVVASRSK